MLKLSLIGSAVVTVTVIIHALGTTAWLRLLMRRFLDEKGAWSPSRELLVFISTVLVFILLHTLQIIAWAVAYRIVLPPGQLDTFEAALYFSFVTFATLGYGDITLQEGWRLLSGIEALNGILMIGWTTALLIAVAQRGWKAKSGTG